MSFYRRIAVIYRPSRECLEIARSIEEGFRNRGLSVKSYWVDDALRNAVGPVDIVVAVGGDGTMLKISRVFQDASPLVLPVPCGRRKAFYEEIGGDVETIVKRVLNTDFYIEELERVKISYNNKSYKVLNEAALISRDHGRVIQAWLKIITPTSKTTISYEGDGVLIGPPSGSSAYHLSTGGSLLDYYVPAIFITPLNPIELNITSLIAPYLSRITVSFTNGYAELYVDGEKKDVISPETPVEAELDPRGLRIIRFSERRNYVREVFEKRTIQFSAESSNT